MAAMVVTVAMDMTVKSAPGDISRHLNDRAANRRPRNTVLWRCSAVLLVLSGSAANAAEFDYEFWLGATYSDNIARTEESEVDETVALTGFSLTASSESNRFEGDLDAAFEYREYLDDSFDSELIPDVSGSLVVKLLPSVFHWVFEDDFGVTQNDPFGVSTPENREDVNVFATGPDWYIRFGKRTTFVLQGRFRDSYFELSDVDNTTTSGTISLVRSISRNRSVSLNASVDAVRYDRTLSIDEFDRRYAYFGFSSEVSRGAFEFQLGVNEVDLPDDTRSGAFASVSLVRSLSSRSQFTVAYDQRYSDAGDVFSRFGALGALGTDFREVIPVDDPFETRRFSAAYSYNRNAVTVNGTAYWSEDSYELRTDLTSERVGGSANLSVALRSGLTLRGRVALDDREFTVDGQSDRDTSVGVYADTRMTRLLSFTLGYEYLDRSSDRGQSFSENRYVLRVNFSPAD